MTSARTKHLTGVLYVFIAAMLWGTTGVAATFAPELSPLAIGAVAMGVGGLLQGGVAFSSILRQRRQIVRRWHCLLVGALAVAVYPLAFYTSMHCAGVAVGTVISMGSAPLLSALIENRLDRLSLTRRWAFGASLGVSGMILLSLTESNVSHVVSREQTIVGVLLGIIAGLTYALYSWSAHRMMQQEISPCAAMGATFSAGGILLLPVLLMTGTPLLHSWMNISVGIYMALGPMFIGYICYGAGLARIRASTATTITLLEPVVATMLAIVLVGEHLPLIGWLGIGLIVICLLIITLPKKDT